jgi:3-carboxy-cis,cis-muconate cycloisomerase
VAAHPADTIIFGDLFAAAEMRAIFSERGFVQRMLEVEAALARAEARLGIVPADAAAAITAAARVERVSLDEIGASTRTVGYPVVGLVKALGAAAGGNASRYVHWGATTQDIMDSALVLQMRDGLAHVATRLEDVIAGLADLAHKHRDTVMAGRTHLQHALPVTFGYKCAVWLAPLLDHRARLAEVRSRALTLQFGGAVGTLASLGSRGRAVAEGLSQELGLTAPVAPWHANRERVVEVAAFLGLVCGSLAKIATDVILLMQSEVAEAFEPHESGRGGSSTMPQKRNPIASEYVIAAARGAHALVPLMLGAMAQDHERATGPWQSEWLAMPQLFLLTSGALAHAAVLARGLSVDAEQMRRGLAAHHGLIMAEAVMMALAEKIGRDAAHHAVQRACDRAIARDRPLVDMLAEDAAIAPYLDRDALIRLAEPASYLGEAAAVIDRVLRQAGEIRGGGP